MVLHKSVITYFNYNLFLKIGQYLIMNKCYSENLFNITIFWSEMSKLDTNLLCSLDKKAEVE